MKVLVFFLCLTSSLCLSAQRTLIIHVRNSVTQSNISGAKAILMDEKGTPIDSTKSVRTGSYNIMRSSFIFEDFPKSGHYRLHVSAQGYEEKEVPLEVHFNKREFEKYMPPVELTVRHRERTLNEATVTATKVKFYTKDDTLIYNADAFQLAEGSMLDALVRQLPGVELKDDGRIYVNGRYVESLLLNGEDFFKGDNKIMLDNLPAYMVKDLRVYEREKDQMARWQGTESGKKEMVMDVKLKKQYSIGWIANTEWGAGTEERWLGRLFAMRFSQQSRFTFVGNMNNVNDSRRPGEQTEWTPDMATGGQLTSRMAGLDYLVTDKDGKWRFMGDATFKHPDNSLQTGTSRTNFLNGGDTYERNRAAAYGHNYAVTANTNWFFRLGEKNGLLFKPNFSYECFDSRTENLNGVFNSDPHLSSEAVIDSLYLPVIGGNMQKILINRALMRGSGEGHKLRTGGHAEITLHVPHCDDRVSISFGGSYGKQEEKRFQLNRVDYFSTKEPADFRNEYRNSPENDYSYNARIEYEYKIAPRISVTPSYKFSQEYSSGSRSLYRLDLLDGWDEASDNPHFGTLPSTQDWTSKTINETDSYHAGQMNRNHSGGLEIFWSGNRKGRNWNILLTLPVTHTDRRLYYQRDKQYFTPRRTATFFEPMLDIDYSTHKWRHSYHFVYRMTSDIPSLLSLVDFTDRSTPLYEHKGNAALGNTHTHHGELTYSYSYRRINASSALTASIVQDAIATAVLYDRTTGIRTTRPENVNGNWLLASNNTIAMPIDKRRKLTWQARLNATYYHNIDLSDAQESGMPLRSTVGSLYTTLQSAWNYKLGKQNIGLSIRGTYGHINGNRHDFITQNVGDAAYTLTGKFSLPWGVSLSTDLNLFSRYGYDNPAMNTNDLVWNARLSRAFLPGKNLIVMFDGFDILQQLSNITYAINAQGRAETFRNVIPRYAMLHVIYRLNIKPGKRPGDE